MDFETGEQVGQDGSPPERAPSGSRVSRRAVLRYGLAGAAGLAGAGALARWLIRSPGVLGADVAEVFKNDAPQGSLWEMWNNRGWVKEARHYLKLGRNVQCKLCPNDCLLEPEDRGRCRNRVNKDGKLYTLAYGNPCSFHNDAIEKKPLFHFLPGTKTFSIATTGCGLRCLNCQNWEISQRKPEQIKDPRGDELRLSPDRLKDLTLQDVDRLSMFPEDVVALARHEGSHSIAYTYSEPTSFYEYMTDTAALARRGKIGNVWVTCGYIRPEPLEELCLHLNAATVALKSFSDRIYRDLNSGKLQPILEALKTLKRRGVWLEVSNLVVPTYTDDLDMIRRMCDWLLDNLGPDCPLHFTRFHPAHKLAHLPPTPAEALVEARSIARQAGMRYVYIGNVRGVEGAETTFCPGCGKAVIERQVFGVLSMRVREGKCEFCGGPIAGVWST